MASARSGQGQTTSDWMEFERRPGISITATALQFPHGGLEMTLLDTPGHHDFSEDTLRVMSAADCAVVLLDASRGIERREGTFLRFERTAHGATAGSEERIAPIAVSRRRSAPGRRPRRCFAPIGEMLAAFRDEFDLRRFLERERGASAVRDPLGDAAGTTR